MIAFSVIKLHKSFILFCFQVIELLSDEKIQMSSKQMTEILNLVNKEEILEMEGKVEKALGQAKIAAAHAAAAAVNVALRVDPQAISVEKIPMDEDVKKPEMTEENNKNNTEEERKKASGNQSGSA